jgi:anti-sigma factor RsiW
MTHLTDEEAQRFADELLSAEASASARAHLDACADCEALVLSFRALCDALDGLDEAPVPASFTRDVMSRLEVVEEARSWERRLAFGILVVTSAMTAIVFGLAGGNAWAPALSRVCGGFVGAMTLGASVLVPIVRALRLEIALGCGLIAIPLIFALSRLVPRRVAALG